MLLVIPWHWSLGADLGGFVMGMRYTKDDVEFHAEGYHGAAAPAVNVRVYGSIRDVLRSDAAMADATEGMADTAELAAFRAYVEGLVEAEDDTLEHVWGFAIESGWEQLQHAAEHIFDNYRARVRSEGRQGGWCCVDGLPELEDWDAVLLAKWRKFERWAKEGAAGIPRNMVSLLYINEWEWIQAENAKRELAMEEATTLGTSAVCCRWWWRRWCGSW